METKFFFITKSCFCNEVSNKKCCENQYLTQQFNNFAFPFFFFKKKQKQKKNNNINNFKVDL